MNHDDDNDQGFGVCEECGAARTRRGYSPCECKALKSRPTNIPEHIFSELKFGKYKDTHIDVVRLIDRQYTDIAQLEKENKKLFLKARALDRIPLCPDCRDKQQGKFCLSCSIAELEGLLAGVLEDLEAYDPPVAELWRQKTLRGERGDG